MSQQEETKRVPSTISRRQFLKATAAATAAIGIATPILAACTAVPAAPSAAPAGEGAAPSTAVADVMYWDMVWGPPEYVDTGK
jgi:hypothetical protein